VEAVFPPVPVESHRKLTGIHRKKIQQIFGAFLQDPVTFPLLSFRSLRDLVAVIFDFGRRNKALYMLIVCFFFVVGIIFQRQGERIIHGQDVKRNKEKKSFCESQ
jgi:hypothetical protein